MGQKPKFQRLRQASTKIQLPRVTEDRVSDSNVKPRAKKVKWKKLNFFRHFKRFGFRKFRLSRLRVRVLSPVLLIKKIRDGYVRAMLSLASSTSGYGHEFISGNHMSFPPAANFAQNHRINEDDYEFYRQHIE